MSNWKKVGGGSFGVYKKEAAPVWPWVVVFAVIGLIVLANS